MMRAWRKGLRVLRGRSWEEDVAENYLRLLRRDRPDAVMAEYGEMGVYIVDACCRAGIPLVVHFHGYDASLHRELARMQDSYKHMFAKADAIVAVSRAMSARLLKLGADPEKLHLNPYGIQTRDFRGASPESQSPVFLAVGRFVPKKAPQTTILAFAEVHRQEPASRLRMIGFGPLEEQCKQLARELQIDAAVQFLGGCTPAMVQQEMRGARCFVQHSVEAPDGDSEGTPLSILEASGSGLPVVSTRHGGIADAVKEGTTGFLVEEHDVKGMAEQMLRLAREPDLAARLGRSGRQWICREYSLDVRINALWRIISNAIDASRHKLRPAMADKPTLVTDSALHACS